MTMVTSGVNVIASEKETSYYDKEIDPNLPPSTITLEDLSQANKYDSKGVTFQKAMRLCILIGQCFGLNPVLGIFEEDPSKLRFVVHSIRCLYTFASIVLQGFVVSLVVLWLARDDTSSVSANGTLVFFGTNTMITVLFLRIAKNWPALCRQISKLEAAEPNTDRHLVKRCNLACVVVLLVALLEHILAIVSGIVITIDCQPDTNLFQASSYQSFSWLWAFFEFNHVLAFLIQWINIQCTFNWNFADAFIICISLYLTARFKQLNEKILAARGKYVSSKFWQIMREDYCKVSNLVRKVDDVISCVILISFANNLFFICLQLFHILDFGIKPAPACGKSLDSRPLKGFEQAVYFVYSFGFLLGRYLTVSLIAARVHTASKMPAQALYDVPSPTYCIEVQRFIDQVHGDTVALSGLQFFYVKRGLLLTVAGTIVTYELVLMQFAGVTTTTKPSLLGNTTEAT